MSSVLGFYHDQVLYSHGLCLNVSNVSKLFNYHVKSFKCMNSYLLCVYSYRYYLFIIWYYFYHFGLVKCTLSCHSIVHSLSQKLFHLSFRLTKGIQKNMLILWAIEMLVFVTITKLVFKLRWQVIEKLRLNNNLLSE